MMGHKGQLTVCVDFNSVESWLSLAPLVEMLQSKIEKNESLDHNFIELDWLPLVRGLEQYSNENRMTDTDDEFENYKRKRQKIRAEYARTNKIRYAEILGLNEKDIFRQFDTRLVSIALLWVKDKSPKNIVDFMVAVFDTFFKEHQNLQDADSICSLLKHLGCTCRGFDDYCTGKGAALLEEIQDKLAELGLFAAPAYFLEGERYIGRQHLPLIQWHLLGEKGTPPV